MKEKIIENKKTLFIIFFGILAIILVCIQIFGGKNKNNDITIVTSSSKFYTVSNCVYRYITYLQSKDADNLLLLLDSNYKLKNNISSGNVLNNLISLDGIYNFEARKMYQEVINDNVTKYYVYGYLIQDSINGVGDKIDFYVVVTLDIKKKIFSITPYDGDMFNGGKDEKE